MTPIGERTSPARIKVRSRRTVAGVATDPVVVEAAAIRSTVRSVGEAAGGTGWVAGAATQAVSHTVGMARIIHPIGLAKASPFPVLLRELRETPVTRPERDRLVWRSRFAGAPSGGASART